MEEMSASELTPKVWINEIPTVSIYFHDLIARPEGRILVPLELVAHPV